MPIKLKQINIIYFLMFLFTLVIFTESKAQSFQRTYGNFYGSEANSVINTNDGGYAIAGWYDVDGLFSAEFYLVKTNAIGDTLWAKTYGSKTESSFKNLDGGGNVGYRVIQTQDEGFLFVGEKHEVDGGQSDVFVFKTNEKGDLLWNKIYGGPENDLGYAVVETDDQGFVVGGYTESYGEGIRDMYLIKIDREGEVLWTKTYGGSSIDAAFDLHQTSDGGLVIAGHTFSFSESSDVYVIRTDENGSILWQKNFGGSFNDIAYSITETQDEGFIICGETESFGAGFLDAYLLKLNKNGALEWSKSFGGENFDSGRSIAEASDGGYALAGQTRSFGEGEQDFYLVKTDASGNLLWAKTYGGSFDDAARSIRSTIDNGFIISGYTKSYGAGFSDLLLIKTDSLGLSGSSLCEQDANETIVTEVESIEQVTNSIIGQGGVNSSPSTRVGSTRTSISNPCDIFNSVENTEFDKAFTIYPNPAQHVLMIESTDHRFNKNIQVEIYNVLGKRISSFPLNNNAISISDFSAGIYIVNLKTGKQIYSYKFVKN